MNVLKLEPKVFRIGNTNIFAPVLISFWGCRGYWNPNTQTAKIFECLKMIFLHVLEIFKHLDNPASQGYRVNYQINTFE